MATDTIRVLLADDHVVLRRGARAVIESIQSCEVCGEVETGRGAVEACAQLQPHVVVMDVTMPDLNGLEATRQIKKRFPEIEVIMFTGVESEDVIFQVFEAGARSYILKTDGAAQFENAICAAAAHKSYFTTEVGEVLFSRFLSGKGRTEPVGDGASRLTDREREIVQLLCEGMGNKQVADHLGISVKTAETHRAAIMKKLKLQSFSELVRYAVRNHIVSA